MILGLLATTIVLTNHLTRNSLIKENIILQNNV